MELAHTHVWLPVVCITGWLSTIKQVRRYRVRSGEALTMWATSSGVDAV